MRAAPPASFHDPESGLMLVNTASFPMPLVTPLHVFAAHRESFDVIVRRNVQKPAVLDALFEALPLAENGWDRGRIKLRHIGNSERLYPIWHVERVWP